MKLKAIIVVIAVMLAAIVKSQAYNIEGITTNYSSFNASLVLLTNKAILPNTDTNIEVNSIGKAKITNKQLLALFSSWMNTNAPATNWPVGARLIFDWQTYQVCVADASGTNILMYCLDDFRVGDGTVTTNTVVRTKKHGKHGTVTVTNITYVTNFVQGKFLQVDWFHAIGASAESLNDNNPGSDKFTEYDGSYFRLRDNAGATEVTCQGANVEKFLQTWDLNGNGLTWKDSESSRFGNYGGQTVNGVDHITAGGSLSASGSGKGYNPKIN